MEQGRLILELLQVRPILGIQVLSEFAVQSMNSGGGRFYFWVWGSLPRRNRFLHSFQEKGIKG